MTAIEVNTNFLAHVFFIPNVFLHIHDRDHNHLFADVTELSIPADGRGAPSKNLKSIQEPQE
jgi:hypothetical protein